MPTLLPLTLTVPLAILCWLCPITLYFLSLSLFGLPHIYYELYYIKHRYRNTFPRPLVVSILILLTCIVIIKIITLVNPLRYAYFLELLLIAGLLIICCIYRQTPSSALVLGCFVFGILYFPIVLFLILAFLHNLTPLGFFKYEGYVHKVWIHFLLIPFVLFAMVIFINPPQLLWIYLHQATQHIAPLANMLSHYLPTWSHDQLMQSNTTGIILRAFFSMAVFYQLMHYDSTIRILPSLIKLKQKKLSFYSCCLFSGFAIATFNLWVNFIPNKQIYSIAAAFHAWLEIPLLYLLFSNSISQEEKITT